MATEWKKSPAYQSWSNMKTRCLNQTCPEYRHYGGRGITVCDEWLSYKAFQADMGERPPGTELERIDNNGNYEPGNCRWATRSEQTRNTRRNRFVTVGTETLCIADWAKRLGIAPPAITMRINRYGWSPEEAVSRPAVPQHLRRQLKRARRGA